MPSLADRSTVLCLGIVVAGLMSGCAGPAKEALEIRQPRAILMPPMGSVYLTVVNPGSQSDRLLRAETPAARLAEIHESRADNHDVMHMVEHSEGFEVPAGGTLELQPGGLHIMLVEPRLPADAKGTIALTLHFARAGAIQVQAEISQMGAEAAGGSGQP